MAQVAQDYSSECTVSQGLQVTGGLHVEVQEKYPHALFVHS